MSTFSTDLFECKISHIPSDHMPVNATPASHLLVSFPLAQPREESSFPLTFSAAQLHKVTRFSPVVIWWADMIHAVLSWLTIPSHIDCSIFNDRRSSQYPCIHFKNILDNLWGKRNIETHSQNGWVRMTCCCIRNGHQGVDKYRNCVSNCSNPLSGPVCVFCLMIQTELRTIDTKYQFNSQKYSSNLMFHLECRAKEWRPWNLL